MEFEVVIATSWFSRLRGMLFGRGKRMKPGQVMALLPCKSVHTMLMVYPIDVAFVNARGIVVKARAAMPRGRAIYCKGAVCALERRSVEEDWFEPGDRAVIAVRNSAKAEQKSAQLDKGKKV